VNARQDDRDAAAPAPQADLVGLLSTKIIGQSQALQYITPYVRMYQAGLNAPDRPAGIFLLLGPTGTGKTRTVEALAEILHGRPKHLLKIDCAEYQSDHEVAKLIGAPPGYVGHRDSRPMLTQDRLAEIVTPDCDLALVLFDEIEKAAPALTTLLLGVLDKATLRLGDNSLVNLEKTLIFMTSNLGAREMGREIQPDIGFQAGAGRSTADLASRLEHIALAAVRKRFSPEFVNRLDAVITYRPLDAEAIAQILDSQIGELQKHVHTRLAAKSFDIEVTPEARRLILARGTSPAYGARELKRTIHRMLTQPLATLVADAQIAPGQRVIADCDAAGEGIALRVESEAPAAHTGAPLVLILDDNEPLSRWLEREVASVGVETAVVSSAKAALDRAARQPIDLAIVDLVLPDGDGLSVAFELVRRRPELRVVIMTGGQLSSEEIAECARHEFPVLRKPFLGADITGLVRATLRRSITAVG
jgi:DNA-binding NtrC family response regulator